jgi:hypothetical protein
MASKTVSAPVVTPADRAATTSDQDTSGEWGRPEVPVTARSRSIEWIGLATAVLSTIVIYARFLVFLVAHEPLNTFLTTTFGRGNAAIWPMQLVLCASAVAMVGLAFWPPRRASQLICLLAAAVFAWVGIVFFGVIYSGMAIWAAAFIVEAILLLAAGVVRRDLVFAPRWNVASALGAVFMFYALVAYPIIEMLGGYLLRVAPLFGLALCVTVMFAFGLLLWACPPVPLYVQLIPLAWALQAAPGNLAMGHVPDFPLILVGMITAGLIIWRDRTSIWLTMAAGFVLAWMIIWSGHDDVEVMVALLLVVVTLASAIWGDAQPPRASRPPQLSEHCRRRDENPAFGRRVRFSCPASSSRYWQTSRLISSVNSERPAHNCRSRRCLAR